MKTVDIRGTADERKVKLEAVKDLRDYDHAFLSEEGVAKFAEVFGVTLKPTKHYAEPNHPKGLHLANGAKSAVGMDSSEMAQSICNQLDVKYSRMMGRGFQLRVCCDALEKYFSK